MYASTPLIKTPQHVYHVHAVCHPWIDPVLSEEHTMTSPAIGILSINTAPSGP